MASSGEKAFEKQLMDAGKKLLKPPASVEELLPLLDKVESCLSRVEQSPSVSMQNALSPSMKALVTNELLRHLDTDVKVAVASCISEITRITAPDAPYDDDQMKEIFQLIVVAFEKLSDSSSRSYSKRVSILETVAKVRSCVVMLDLECDALILEMFQHFLKAIRDNHPDNVFSSMETIMTLVLEESEEISSELLYPILTSVKKEKQDVLPVAKRLAEKVLENCTAKLKPYLKQAVESIGTSMHDYSKIVASICQEKSDDTERNDGSAPEEHLANQNRMLETGSDEPHQVAEELKPETPSHEEVDPIIDKSEKPVSSNGDAQPRKDDSMIGLDSLEKKQRSDVDSSKIIESETNPDHDGQETEDQKPHSSVNSMEASDSSQINSGKDAKELPDERKQSNEEANNSLSEHPVADQVTVPSDHEEDTQTKLSPTTAENTESASIESPSPMQSRPEGTQPKKGRRPKKKGNSNMDSDPGSSSVAKEALSSEKVEDAAPPSEDVISGKGSEDVISGKGSEDVISEKGSEDVIAEKGSEDVITEKGSEDAITEKESEDIITEKGSEDVIMEEGGSEDVIMEKGSEDVITEKESEDVITEKESEDDKDIKTKSHGHSGRKVSRKKSENKTPRRADVIAKESGVASDSDAKPLKQSGKKVDERKINEDEPSADKQEGKRKRGRETDSKKDVIGEPSSKVDEKNADEDENSADKQEGRTKRGREKNNSKKDVTGEPSSKVVERNVDEDERSGDKQDGRTKRGRGKSNSKKDITGEPSSKKLVSPPKSTKSSNEDQSHLEETPKTKSKRKRTPGKEETRTPGKDEASKLNTVEERKKVVGSTIEVLWPDDNEFYKGIIESYDHDKGKHKVAYVDGDVEILNLNKETWKFVEKENDTDRGQETELCSPDSSSEMPLSKKMKGNLDSSKAQTKTTTSAKRGKGSSSSKSKGRVTKSDGKSKIEISKSAGKSKDDSGGKSKDVPSKASDKLKDDTPVSGSKSKDDSPSTKDDKVGKSKDRTPKSSSKPKEDANKRSGKSKDETTKTPAKPKGGGTPKINNKPSANGTSAAKGKSGLSKLEENKDLSDNELLSSSSKAKESETKSGRKRQRKSRG